MQLITENVDYAYVLYIWYFRVYVRGSRTHVRDHLSTLILWTVLEGQMFNLRL